MKRKPFTANIQFKITFGILLILGVSLFGLGYYIIDSQRSMLLRNLREQGERLAVLVAEASAAPIEKFSFFRLEELSVKVEQSPLVAFCEIYDQDGISLVRTDKIVSDEHKPKKARQTGENVLIIEKRIVSGSEFLGKAEIGLYLDHVHREIRSRTLQLMWIFLGVLAWVACSINFFLNRMFITPVIHLCEATESLAKGEFVITEPKGRQDEIGELFQSFNHMSRQLEQLYQDLEHKVNERTRDLGRTNRRLGEAMAEARRLAKDAEAANNAKGEFLATMSHEIRNPMNAILAMADLLWESELTMEQKKFVRIFRDAGRNLLVLINEVLDISKIEAGQVELEQVPFNLFDVVNRVIRVMESKAGEKGLKLASRIMPGTPSELLGDPFRLYQVLFNLMSNAVKFTDRGEVAVEIREGNHIDSSRVEVQFSVRDSGIGISKDKLEYIFDIFTQADSSTTRKYGGTGLGLAICRKLVHMMDGRIEVESREHHGSSFNFTAVFEIPPDSDSISRNDMPVQESDSLKNEERPVPQIGAPRILTVEDSDYNRFIIKTYLKHTDSKLDTAKNGEEGFRKFVSGSYDIVLMDMQMPVMDGYTATRKIREWEREYRLLPTPVIAMTAYAMPGDAQKCIDAGCDAYLSKPVRKSTMLEMIRRFTPSGKTAGNSGKTNRPYDEMNPNIGNAPSENRDGPIFVNVDPDLKAIVPGFLESISGNARKIIEALDQGDFETIHILSHSMKGEGAAFGFDPISEFGASIQEACNERIEDRIREHTRLLVDYIDRVEYG